MRMTMMRMMDDDDDDDEDEEEEECLERCTCCAWWEEENAGDVSSCSYESGDLGKYEMWADEALHQWRDYS